MYSIFIFFVAVLAFPETGKAAVIPIAKNDITSVIAFLIAGIVVITATFIIIRRYLRIRFALKRGYTGSQLQSTVVKTFSLVTIIPTVVISVFSIAFFYYGIKDWFNERITIVLEESVAVAEAYIEEHQKTLRADARAMANDIQRDIDLMITNPPRFGEILNGQVAIRSLSEAIIIYNNRVVARSLLSFSLSFDNLPSHVINVARNGDVALMDKGDRLFAVVAIDPLNESFLVISRLVDEKVIGHIERSRGAATKYHNILGTVEQLQVIFVIGFVMVTCTLLLSIIWYGIGFAARITTPLISVAQATERVRAGDYSIQIEENSDNEEMDMLIRHFNRMTEQLYTQRLELTQVTRMLDQRRRFTESVLSGVSAGIIALDTNIVVGLCNISALHLLGYDNEREMVGRSLRSLLPEFSLLLTTVLHNPSRTHEAQIDVVRKGQTTTLQVKISAEMSQNHVEGYIVTLDDITPLISAQRSAAWSDVARRVAHEIKNPLTPIKLSVDRLRKKFAPEGEEEKESFDKYLSTITRHLRDIANIVEEFSSFARMPAPNIRKSSLQPLLEGAIFSAETSTPNINHTLYMEDTDIELECDESQISQVLTNLLKNAAESIERREDATESGDIHVYCCIQRNQVIINLEDNGVGFPEHLIHKIMEPYVTTRAKGTGLGLAIVKKIIEDHKGTITVGNLKNSGAIVTLAFPKTS